MKKRYIWLGITGLILVIIVAGIMYTAHFASAVNQSHTAPGAATATGTPLPATGLQTFQIVSDQTTATYSVYENLIFQNKPNNDAIGTTHSVTGSFKIHVGASPFVGALNITVDLRTLMFNAPTNGEAPTCILKLPVTECVVPIASLFGLFWKIRFSYTL